MVATAGREIGRAHDVTRCLRLLPEPCGQRATARAPSGHHQSVPGAVTLEPTGHAHGRWGGGVGRPPGLLSRHSWTSRCRVQTSGSSPPPVLARHSTVDAMTQPGATESSEEVTRDDKGAMTPEVARRVLATACRQVDLDPSDAELIRIGSNAVFRLRTPVIVRIAQGSDVAESAGRQVEVARWLEAVDYPATRALDVEQPVYAEGRVATFWVSVSEAEAYAPIDQVADLIRRLHELEAPPSLDLPELAVFDRILNRLSCASNGMLTEEECVFLESRVREMRSRYASLEFALPRGPIHGDANVGNVIIDREGKPVLIDLDNFCRGPREWDLVQTALYYERFGWHTQEEYTAFCQVYGFDIMAWPGYETLADIHELRMVAWLSGNAAKDPRSSRELKKRLASLRDGGSRKHWSPL